MLDFLGQFEAVGARNLAWNLFENKEEEQEQVSFFSTAMDYSSYVDTSLDLNSKPLHRVLYDAPPVGGNVLVSHIDMCPEAI